MKNLEKLFNPKSIAIVGASEEDKKIGNIIARNILDLGYFGEVFLVNPKHESLFGKKCYQQLKDIEKEVDLAIIAIPAKLVNSEIFQNAEKIKNYVIISAGFSEIGEEGKERERELKEIAEKNNLNILGPNCLGFIIPSLKLNASFAAGLPETGNVSFVSQSGALAVALMDVAKKKSIKFSSVISIGNKTQLSESELLEYLDADEKTKVIGMYLEGIKDGQKFIEVAQKIKKPIVILKAGKTEKAQKAIASHTGALAGSDEIIDAVFKKTGVIRAENMDDFLGFLNLISNSEAPRNEEAVVITNAGGLGVLATDAFKNKKIRLAEISEKTKEKLKKILPEESSFSNPIDVLGDADEKRYAKTLDILKKESAGIVICLLTPQDQTPVKKIAQKIIKLREKLPADEKNIVTVFMGGERVSKAIDKLRENNIPNFFLADQAVNALDKYRKWKIQHLKTKNTEKEKIDESRKGRIIEIINKAKSENREALLFGEAKEVMELYGIKTSEFWTVNSKDEVEPAYNAMRSIAGRFPAAVKVDSDKVLHKTDKQGLILNIKNQEELQESVVKIKNNFPGENIIIQPMLPVKNELIVGVKKDEIFGPVVVFGLGGIHTEVFKAADFLIPPMDEEEIEELVMNGKLNFLFRETRGQKPCDVKEIIKILLGMQSLALEIQEIKELDVNPLLMYNDGKEAMAVDVKIII